MHQPKAIKLINTFNKADWRECGYFLRGQYKAGHEALRLFQILKKNKQKLFDPKNDLDEIRSEYFSTITKKSFSNLLSRLNIEIETYFVHNSIKQDSVKSQLELLKALKDRGLYEVFDKKAAQLEAILTDDNRIDLYNELYLMQLNHMRFFSDNPLKNKGGKQLLSAISQYSKSFFENYRIFAEGAVLHFDEISGDKEGKIILRPTNKSVKSTLDQLLILKTSKNQKTFDQLFTLLNNNTYDLSTELQAVILQYLIHFGHKETKSGNLKIGETLLDLYDWGFKNGLLLTNNRIPETRFINFVNFAVAYSTEERALAIVNNLSYLLENKMQNDIREMAYAYIDFSQERYTVVIDRIKDYPFKTVTLHTRRRWLTLCSFYKCFKGDKDFISRQLKNYNNFFYNNKDKLSKSVYSGSLNLSKAIHMLSTGASPSSIEIFLETCKQLFHRALIIKEVEALRASTSS